MLGERLDRDEEDVEIADGTEPGGDGAQSPPEARRALRPEPVAEDAPGGAHPTGRDAHRVELLGLLALPGPGLAGDHPGQVEAEDLAAGLGMEVLGGDAGRLADGDRADLVDDQWRAEDERLDRSRLLDELGGVLDALDLDDRPLDRAVLGPSSIVHGSTGLLGQVGRNGLPDRLGRLGGGRRCLDGDGRVRHRWRGFRDGGLGDDRRWRRLGLGGGLRGCLGGDGRPCDIGRLLDR